MGGNTAIQPYSHTELSIRRPLRITAQCLYIELYCYCPAALALILVCLRKTVDGFFQRLETIDHKVFQAQPKRFILIRQKYPSLTIALSLEPDHHYSLWRF